MRRHAAGRRARVLAGFGAAAVLGLPTPTHLAAQKSVADMIAECQASNALFFQACNDAALALGATRAGVGLAASQGSAVPGSASTLGRRMASSPRLAVSLRTAAARARFGDPNGTRVRTFWPVTVEGQLTVGVLEGWSLLPTVGGFLSVDLFGEIGFAKLSTGAGFDGSTRDLGYGARVGIFRESFTLPGVSVSATRRHLGDVGMGPETGDGTRLDFTPTVTSLRATASKDLLALGVLGGWGWDRYAGRSSLVVRRSIAGIGQTAQASSDDFHTDRQVIFGSLAYTILVLQLSAEGGWAQGFSGFSASSGFKARSSSFFGSVAARLTY